MPLLTETNTRKVERLVRSTFYFGKVHPPRAGHRRDTAFEHGHWWVVCSCGAAWSVVDVGTPGALFGSVDFEEVSHGDNE